MVAGTNKYELKGKGIQVLYRDHLASTLYDLHHRSSVWMVVTPFKVTVQRTALARNLNLWNQLPTGSERICIHRGA